MARRSRSRSRSRDRSRSPERRRQLPEGVSPISESDYFQKNDEFRAWLKDEKRKYFDELSSDKARSYFRKFVKVWNRGKLSDEHYRGAIDLRATSNTSYKWSFASKSSRTDNEAISSAREEIRAATYRPERRHRSRSRSPSRDTRSEDRDDVGPSSSSARVKGPTLPSASDLTLARELDAERREKERAYSRKRDRKDARDRVEDMVGPKPVGKEAMLEKKNARRENDRAFREKGDEGLEVDESTLMGSGGGFQDMLAKRDTGKRRFEQKQLERVSELRERATVNREKEKATMDMFQQLAKQRFG